MLNIYKRIKGGKTEIFKLFFCFIEDLKKSDQYVHQAKLPKQLLHNFLNFTHQNNFYSGIFARNFIVFGNKNG